MTPEVIPDPFPVGLPAPPVLLEILLVLTFLLHVLMMNVLLGGTLTATGLEIAVRLGRRDLRPAARFLVKLLPNVMALTVTFGVAPLLFLQLLYGQFFFTSSILMGWYWLAAVLLMLIGYYGLYVAAWRQGGRRPWILAGSALCFLAVAYAFVHNLLLMTRPHTWLYAYLSSPGGGLHLPLGDVFPRYLHMILFGTSLTGALLVGSSGGIEEGGSRMAGMRVGLWVLTLSLVAQIPVGAWYGSTLSAGAVQALGASWYARVLFVLALVSNGAGWLAAYRLWRTAGTGIKTGIPERAVRFFPAALVFAGTAAMMLLRQFVQDFELQSFLPAGSWKVEVQPVLTAIFLVGLTLAAAVVAWLLYRVRKDRAGGEGPPGAGLPAGGPPGPEREKTAV
ncbi:MAG: hypothetical protein QJR06_04185 [Alicyclobacillaceae bacterium]|nr:hypothetical protein [Alicyclobacillaceae bacterium]